MLRVFFKKSLLLLYYVIGAVILDLISFHILDLGVVAEYFWYNIAIILIIAFLIFIIPNFTAQYVIYTVILLAQTVITYLNYSLYVIYGDLFSLDMISLIKEAGQAMSSSFIYFSVLLQLIAVFIALCVAGFAVLKYCKKQKFDFKQHFSVVVVVMLVAVQCFSTGLLYNNVWNINSSASSLSSEEYIFSDAFYLNTSIMKSSSYSKFGTYGYLVNLVANYINNQTYDYSTLTDEDLLAIEYFNLGETYNSNSSDVFGVDSGNNVIVVMMESLEWFGFGDGTYDYSLNNLSAELTPNIYTLIYGEEAYSVSNNSITYNQNDTSNDSLIATNFYAKSKTNYSEGQGILGNYPTGSKLKDYVKNLDSSSDVFGYALPYVLSELGYNTTYVHSYLTSFYERNETHSYLGFDTVVGKGDITDSDGNAIYSGDELTWGHWDCEGSFVSNAIDYIIPYDPTSETNDPFYTFYLTVSTHGSYQKSETEGDCVKYVNYVMYGADDCYYDKATNSYKLNKSADQCTYSTWYQNVLDVYGNSESELFDMDVCSELLYYECGVMGLDEAIGVIIQQLKDYGIYDSTTIVLYSDHYAYYNSLSNKVKGFSKDDVLSVELNTIPMIISSPGLKSGENAGQYTVYDGFCSAYDIIPTLFDLLGVEFNQNFYIGSSIFSAKDYVYTINGVTYAMEVYYSNTSGLFSEYMYSYDLVHYYLSDKGKELALTDEELAELESVFYAEAKAVVTKVNYLQILNSHRLYPKLSQF